MIPKLSLALFLSLFLVNFSLGAPGDLDLTFGSAGRALGPVGKVSFDAGRAAALQPDGKIVVVGDSGSDGQFGFEPTNLLVTRLNASGSRDVTFGLNGVVVLRLRAQVNGAAVVIQPDGKIVVGGFMNKDVGVNNVKRHFLLARLLSDGTLDSSFGSNGISTPTLDSSIHTTLTSLALQSDGKIVAAGFSGLASPTTPVAAVVARYQSNGSLDNPFDGDGKRLINVNPEGNRANAVLIQPDGKIVIGGSLRETSSSLTDFLLVRLNTDGMNDNSFDGDGVVTTRIQSVTSVISGIRIQPDGKIIAAGTSGPIGTRNIAVVRYEGNGTPDSSFDNDGIVTTDIGDELGTSVALDGSGRIVVGAQIVTPNPTFGFIAVRYNANGTPDNSFDGDGVAITPFAITGTMRPTATLVNSDGKIILAGSRIDTIDGDLALARYNVDGSLDSGFDDDGKALLELANANDAAYAMAVQADGKIVTAGYAFGGVVVQPALTRFLPNGSIDTTFGTLGSIILPPPELFIDSYANDVAIQPDGKIVFTVTAYEGLPFRAVRLNTNGTLDATFGDGGIASVPVTPGDHVYGLAIQSDGKIVMAGNFGSPTIVRLTALGVPDGDFGMNGVVMTTDPLLSGSVFGMTLQPDGKIIVVGSRGTGDPNDASFFTSRYNANGTIDATFGGTGAVVTSIGLFDSASTVAVQADGKIVVGGSSGSDAAAVRYNSNGTLDNSFDGDGKVVIAGQASLPRSFADIATQSNGKLVLVGAEQTLNNGSSFGKYDAAMFRLNPDGSPDNTFGNGGTIIKSIGNHNSLFSDVAVLPNGRILAAGVSSNGLNDDFTVMRYVGDPASSFRAPFDFDGDGKTDIGIFRPILGAAEWWINRSGNGQTFALQFGSSTDRIAPADYTGDGKTDIAFFRPASGEWYVLRSEDFSFFALPFGTNGDVPVPADYDADGKADFAVYRPSSSTWFISQSSGAPTRIEGFGIAGDQPVVADYDGDNKADVGIFRNNAGVAEWWINRSTAGVLAIQFGAGTDKAVQGDYTGDGKADIAIWRPADGNWLIVRSEDFSFFGFPFGANGDVPSPGDYDGDGKFDPTVFRPSSATWFSGRTTAGTLIVQFGATGDRPIPNSFVP